MEKDNQDLFDHYIRRQLPEQEANSFEQRLETDDSLKKEFEEYQLLAGGIALAGSNSLKSKLQRHELTYVQPRASLTLYFRIAAAVILLATLSFLIYNYASQPSYEKLYLAYYSPYPNIVDHVSRSDRNSELNIYQLYEAKRYNEVIEIVDVDSENEAEHFYLGQSYLAINNTKPAISAFDKIKEPSKFFQASQWYIALCFLQSGQNELLEKKLHEIADYQGDYSEKAIDLLKNL